MIKETISILFENSTYSRWTATTIVTPRKLTKVGLERWSKIKKKGELVPIYKISNSPQSIIDQIRLKVLSMHSKHTNTKKALHLERDLTLW